LTCSNHLAGRHERASRDHGPSFYENAVHFDGSHPDEAAGLQRAGVNERHVPDRNLVAD
jgi:hypothetical protein